MQIKHALFLTLVLAMLWTGNLFGYATGPDTGLNGVFGASVNCTNGCHNSFPVNSGTGGVTLSGQPATWTPGQTYSLTVTVLPSTSPTSVRYGFQLSAVIDSTN